MDEAIKEGIFGSIQDRVCREEICTIWSHRQESELRIFPTNFNCYNMGCILPPMDILHSITPSNQKCDNKNPGSIPLSKTETFKQTVQDGRKSKPSSIYSQPHICIEKHEKDQEKERQQEQDCTIHVWSICSLTKFKNATKSSENEIKEYVDISICEQEFCINRTRIQTMQPPLGELQRICSMGGSGWEKGRPCKYVHPYYIYRKHGEKEPMHKVPKDSRFNHIHDNNSTNSSQLPMIVEKIVNESDSQRIAAFIQLELCKETELTCYLEEVQTFGFNHIIIVGRLDYGVLFLDCYGRVFNLDTMSGVLWPFGDTLKEAAKPWTGAVSWVINEKGTVFEYEYYSEAERYTHVYVDSDEEDKNTRKVNKVQVNKAKKANKAKRNKKKKMKNKNYF